MLSVLNFRLKLRSFFNRTTSGRKALLNINAMKFCLGKVLVILSFFTFMCLFILLFKHFWGILSWGFPFSQNSSRSNKATLKKTIQKKLNYDKGYISILPQYYINCILMSFRYFILWRKVLYPIRCWWNLKQL